VRGRGKNQWKKKEGRGGSSVCFQRGESYHPYSSRGWEYEGKCGWKTGGGKPGGGGRSPGKKGGIKKQLKTTWGQEGCGSQPQG